MKKGNWIAIDKRLVKLLPTNRAYTYFEALLSLTIDIDNGARHTVKGYVALWRWSRNKVRRFIRTLEAGQDYLIDTRRDTTKTPIRTLSRHPIRLIFNNLHIDKDPCQDPHLTPTIYPTDPNPKVNDKGLLPEQKSKSYSLPFTAYREKYEIPNKEAAEVVEYFVSTYQKRFRKKHPYLKPETWEHHINTILFADDGMPDPDFDYESLVLMINRYFKTKFDNCDYSINHFNTDGIKMRRFYEECY